MPFTTIATPEAKPVANYKMGTRMEGGRLLYISGQVGVAHDGTILDGFEAQARQTWDNVIAAVQAGGMDVRDIVKVSTFLISEDLIDDLKQEYTVIIVTHNMQQAARVSDYTAFLYLGELIEFDETNKIFTTPSKQQTQDYITGRFG